MLKFIVLIVGLPLGFWLVRYRAKVVDVVGKMSLAEKYLGDGGTYTAWLVIGTLVSAGSILYFFNLFPGL